MMSPPWIIQQTHAVHFTLDKAPVFRKKLIHYQKPNTPQANPLENYK